MNLIKTFQCVRPSMLILIGTILSSTLVAQQICIFGEESQREQQETVEKSLNSGTLKTVRLVFHYVQDNNGDGNFSDVSQGPQNLDGYELSELLVNIINGVSNIQMNLPPGNTTPVEDRNIDFVVDHVFFHQNNNLHIYDLSEGGTTDALYAFDENNTIQVYMKGQEGGVGEGTQGNASGLALNLNGGNKWIQMDDEYERYMAANTSGLYSNWQTALFHGTGHELFHTLGLSHTVRHNNGATCSETDSNVCNDLCSDTPTPFEMFTIHGATMHPSCDYGDLSSHCSNNWMDYNGQRALTPDQLDRMHSGLENGLISLTVCDALDQNTTVCDLGYPRVRTFGQSVTVGCGGSTPTLESGNFNKIIFSSEVIFEELEIEAGAEFEVEYKGC